MKHQMAAKRVKGQLAELDDPRNKCSKNTSDFNNPSAACHWAHLVSCYNFVILFDQIISDSANKSCQCPKYDGVCGETAKQLGSNGAPQGTHARRDLPVLALHTCPLHCTELHCTALCPVLCSAALPSPVRHITPDLVFPYVGFAVTKIPATR
jgi:hypothetical protein